MFAHEQILACKPTLPALALADRTLSYGEIVANASRMARLLADVDLGPLRVAAISASRSATAYCGAVATHFAGSGYLPLNPKFPIERILAMLDQADTSTIIAGTEGLMLIEQILARAERNWTIIGPEIQDFGALGAQVGRHRFLTASDIAAQEPSRPRPAAHDAVAYLLFTSGSTGRPKGVPVWFANLAAYLDHARVAYAIGPGDRVSQTFDMTFDLSVHDIFHTLGSSACLYPLPETALISPARFIRDQALTVWFSVPSLPMTMARLRTLRPGVFPSLRLALFCGEPLPVNTIEAFAKAAPNSRLLNLYGPTEATIAIADYEWRREDPARDARYGVVPLGRIYPSQRGVLRDEVGAIIEGTGRGELCLGGTQVTRGYLSLPEKTAEQFVSLPIDGPGRWYRTGDLVERDAAGTLHFVGRVDNQIKLHGHRIELQEVDAALRVASGSDLAVAVPWPVSADGVQGIVGCVVPAGSATVDEIRAACARQLPDYMVPARVQVMDRLPLNSAGKIDRRALANLLDQEKPD